MTSHHGVVGAAPSRLRVGQLVVWGVVGLVAQAAFMAGWLIAETWQGRGYSPVSDTISDMQAATAPHVWFPVACFALGGAGTFSSRSSGCGPRLQPRPPPPGTRCGCSRWPGWRSATRSR